MRLHSENLDWISIIILGHGYIYLKSAGDAPKEEDFPPNTELKSDFWKSRLGNSFTELSLGLICRYKVFPQEIVKLLTSATTLNFFDLTWLNLS